jgi:hypothetical protein
MLKYDKITVSYAFVAVSVVTSNADQFVRPFRERAIMV